MIETIGKAVGIEPNIEQLPMQPGDVERTYADISKAKKLIGYEPKTSFEDGIRNFVNWYKKMKSYIDKVNYKKRGIKNENRSSRNRICGIINSMPVSTKK